MSELGFLYILANSSMPGLVKVGKTARSPGERASELSAATGLPTPFIVVYEQLFHDCGAAESFVHAYLAQKGYRVSDNREFFNAPANVVVRAICLAPEPIDDAMLPGTQGTHERTNQSGTPDTAKPWATLFEQAEGHYYGREHFIKDNTTALKLFKQAAKLGARPAFRYMAEIFGRTKFVYWANCANHYKSVPKLLEIYREGAYKGSAYCWWEIGMMLSTSGIARPQEIPRERIDFTRMKNEIDAAKCFEKFFEMMPGVEPDGDHLTREELELIYFDCIELFDEVDNVMVYPDINWTKKDIYPSVTKFIFEHREVLTTRQSVINEARTRCDNLSRNTGHKT